MVKWVAGMLLMMGSSLNTLMAADIEHYKTAYFHEQKGNSGWFLSAPSHHHNTFDVWQIDSGYRYNVSKNTQLYLNTHLIANHEAQHTAHSIASGVKYHLTPKVSLQSEINTITTEETTTLGIAVSSQYDVSDRLNVRARVDYEQLDQVIAFGLGFNF